MGEAGRANHLRKFIYLFNVLITCFDVLVLFILFHPSWFLTVIMQSTKPLVWHISWMEVLLKCLNTFATRRFLCAFSTMFPRSHALSLPEDARLLSVQIRNHVPEPLHWESTFRCAVEAVRQVWGYRGMFQYRASSVRCDAYTIRRQLLTIGAWLLDALCMTIGTHLLNFDTSETGLRNVYIWCITSESETRCLPLFDVLLFPKNARTPPCVLFKRHVPKRVGR